MRATIVFASLALATAAACSADSTGPSSSSSPPAVTAEETFTASSTGGAIVGREGTVTLFTNLCTGEALTLQGTYLFVDRTKRDGTHEWLGQLHATGTASGGAEYMLRSTRWSTWDATNTTELVGYARELLLAKGTAGNVIVWLHFDYTKTPPEYFVHVDCQS